jgi:hypothetical protein
LTFELGIIILQGVSRRKSLAGVNIMLLSPRVGHRNCPKGIRLSKSTDMTEEHFLMIPLVLQFNHFQEKNAFSEFFSKNPQSIES